LGIGSEIGGCLWLMIFRIGFKFGKKFDGLIKKKFDGLYGFLLLIVLYHFKMIFGGLILVTFP